MEGCVVLDTQRRTCSGKLVGPPAPQARTAVEAGHQAQHTNGAAHSAGGAPDNRSFPPRALSEIVATPFTTICDTQTTYQGDINDAAGKRKPWG